MRLVDELLRLSASDLANHLGCIHLTQLNGAEARGLEHRPRWDDPLGALLQARGLEHEHAYLAHLRAARDLTVECDLPAASRSSARTWSRWTSSCCRR